MNELNFGKENTKGFDREADKDADSGVFSHIVRAGKRTYFLDVKLTRSNDYYLTITESKKKFDRAGGSHFEKHKLYLYKEDFSKFTEGLEDVMNFIKNKLPEFFAQQESAESTENFSVSEDEFDNL